VIATHTLSLLTLKPGLFTGAGRDHAGSVWLDLLGIEVEHVPEMAARRRGGRSVAERRHAAHKGSFGDLRWSAA
jgi:hypothetical protein